jgi:hypothetical protein
VSAVELKAMSVNYLAIFIVFLLAFLFYLLIPGLGAATTLQRWRKFRKNLLRISMYPIVDYSQLAGVRSGNLGSYRFFGTLESIHGENKIWVRGESISIEADLADVSLYFLPSLVPGEGGDERTGEMIKRNMPVSAKWKRIFSLPEGTQMFIGGSLAIEDGHGIFKSQPKESLLVIVYDGDEHSILKRAILCGRQKNEYWNQFTLMSLITGFFSLLLVSYVLLRNPLLRFEALFSINVSLLPIALFMPPGVLLYFLYRLLWKRSRLLLKERDMLQLPLRWFDNKILPENATHQIATLPDGSSYIMAKKDYTVEKGMIVDRDRELLESRVIRRIRGETIGSFIFGAYTDKSDGEIIGKPRDPMVNCIEMIGNPEELASKSNKQARWFAVLSALILLLDVSLNFVVLFYILRDFFK